MTAGAPWEAFSTDDPEQRRRAVIAIGDAPDVAASAVLMSALGDTEWRVRKEAVRVARAEAVSLGLVPQLVAAICQGDNVGLRNASLDVLEVLGAVAADALIAALPTVAAETKKFVIEALACGGDPRVVLTLIETSRGADVMTAVTAIEAMSAIGGPVAERALHTHLTSPESLLQMAALDGLNRLGAVVDWEQLQPLLSNRMARRVAMAALGRSGRREAIEPLVTAVTDRSLHVARTAVTSLAQLQLAAPGVVITLDRALRDLSQEARVRLRDLALDVDATARESAVRLLVAARDEVGLGEVIETAATDMLPPIAHEGLRAWGRPLVRLLLQRPAGDSDRLRAATLELVSDAAWQAIGGSDASDVAIQQDVLRAMREALEGGQPATMLAAVRCLGVWAEAADAAKLVAVATRVGGDIAHVCCRSLRRLAERDRAAVESALDAVSLDGPASAPLIELLGALSGSRAVERLQTALAAADADTRKAAIQGLALLSDPRAPKLIAFALADESVDVQMAAAEALGTHRDSEGRPAGVESLLLALESASDGVRASAARSLGSTGDRRSIPPLRALVSHDNPGVVIASIEALRALADPDAGPLMYQALGHEDAEVVKQALRAIAHSRAPGFALAISTSLSHRDWDVRRLSAELLGGLGDSAALPTLRAQHDREDEELVREAIAHALRKLGAA